MSILKMPISVGLEKAFMKVVAIYRKEESFDKKNLLEEDEPMDSDEVERLARLFWIYADRQQGNLNDDELEAGILKLEKLCGRAS